MFIKNGNIPKLATIPEEQGKATGFKDSLATYVYSHVFGSCFMWENVLAGRGNLQVSKKINQ